MEKAKAQEMLYTLDQYWDDVYAQLDIERMRPGGLRKGQIAFNLLQDYRPELADKIRATILDPFHQETLTQQFHDFLATNW